MTFSALLERADVAVRGILGGTVNYAPSVGIAVDVTGIFDAVYVKVDAGEAGVSSTGPAVFLRLEDLPSDPTTDAATVTVAGIAYSIREAEPDGQGGVLLLLHKA